MIFKYINKIIIQKSALNITNNKNSTNIHAESNNIAFYNAYKCKISFLFKILKMMKQSDRIFNICNQNFAEVRPKIS